MSGSALKLQVRKPRVCNSVVQHTSDHCKHLFIVVPGWHSPLAAMQPIKTAWPMLLREHLILALTLLGKMENVAVPAQQQTNITSCSSHSPQTRAITHSHATAGISSEEIQFQMK